MVRAARAMAMVTEKEMMRAARAMTAAPKRALTTAARAMVMATKRAARARASATRCKGYGHSCYDQREGCDGSNGPWFVCVFACVERPQKIRFNLKRVNDSWSLWSS